VHFVAIIDYIEKEKLEKSSIFAPGEYMPALATKIRISPQQMGGPSPNFVRAFRS
jgi:hypothetical protein